MAKNQNELHFLVTAENPIYQSLRDVFTNYKRVEKEHDTWLDTTAEKLGLNEFGFNHENMITDGAFEAGEPITGLLLIGSVEQMQQVKAKYGTQFRFKQNAGRSQVGIFRFHSTVGQQIREIWDGWNQQAPVLQETLYNAMVTAYNAQNPNSTLQLAGDGEGQDNDTDVAYGSVLFESVKNDEAFVLVVNSITLPTWTKIVTGLFFTPIQEWDMLRLIADANELEDRDEKQLASVGGLGVGSKNETVVGGGRKKLGQS